MLITSSDSAGILNSRKEFCVIHHANEGELEGGGGEGKKTEVFSFFCNLASVDSCIVLP